MLNVYYMIDRWKENKTPNTSPETILLETFSSEKSLLPSSLKSFLGKYTHSNRDEKNVFVYNDAFRKSQQVWMDEYNFLFSFDPEPDLES